MIIVVGTAISLCSCENVKVDNGNLNSSVPVSENNANVDIGNSNSSVPVSENNTPSANNSTNKSYDFPQYFKFYESGYGMDTILVIDQNGNIIPKEKQFTVLYDILTGKPQCQYISKAEKTGEVNEFGGVTIKRTAALFDKDGNQISDYTDLNFSSGFGDLVLMRDGYGMEMSGQSDLPCGLWNYKTSKMVLEGVGNFQVYDAEKKQFIVSSLASQEGPEKIIGIVDETGTLISSPKGDMNYSLMNVVDGMILANTVTEYKDQSSAALVAKPEKTVVFSKDFEVLFEADRIWFGYNTLYGDYISVTNDNRSYICDYNFNICFEHAESENINYFDGEILIRFSRNSSTQESNMTLCDIKSNVLTTNFTEIRPIVDPNDNKTPAESFLAYDDKSIYILNRKGEVLKTKPLPNIEYCTYLGDGIISYRVNNIGEGMLDINLNTLVDHNKYTSVSFAYLEDGGKYETNYNVIKCTYNLPGNERIKRVELLDRSFKPIITGLSECYSTTKDFIAIKKGFSIGLIDYNGNWVHKYPIFSELKMEDSEWSVY